MLEKVVVRWQSQCKFKYEQETSKKKAVTNRSNSGTYSVPKLSHVVILDTDIM